MDAPQNLLEWNRMNLSVERRKPPRGGRTGIGLTAWILGMACACGCLSKSSPPTGAGTGVSAKSLVSAKNGPRTIAAQGRLQPAGGIVRLSALPGDRVESIAVRAGQPVARGTVLVGLESERLRTLELEAAQLKLADAKLQHASKLREGAAAIEGARLRRLAAEQQHAQATASLNNLQSQQDSIVALERQVNVLELLHRDPLTRPVVGTVELESTRGEMARAKAAQGLAEQVAKDAIASSQLALDQAESLVAAAEESHLALQSSSTIEAVEKQIELSRLQLQQATLVAPIDGTILSVHASIGERTAAAPLIELADLSAMVCVAEVHEADVAQVTLGQVAEMRSAALAQPLIGRVIRIDRSVGGAQLRSPNPLARSDFRSMQVWIQIDPEHAPAASDRLNLQVDVVLQLDQY